MDARRLIPLLCVSLVATSCARSAREPVPVAVAPTTAPVTVEAPAVRPAERVVELGRSVEGRAITLHVFGDASDDATLVLGAIHGNEPTSATVASRLLEHLRERPGATEGRGGVAILAVANPDGLARKLRTNKNLVDVNRNFPAANWAKRRKGQLSFGGERSSSEPETLAILAAFERVRPARVVSIHSMAQPCNNYDGPARELAEAMARHNGYPVKDNIGYPTPGSLGSWAGIDRGIPIVTLELPRRLGGEAAWEQNRAALLEAIGHRGEAPAADAR